MNELNLKDAPEFLLNGIMFDGQMVYPLNIEIKCAYMEAQKREAQRKLGIDVLKIIARHRMKLQDNYQKCKENIFNAEFMREHRDKLRYLDFEEFLTELNKISLTAAQKIYIRPSAKTIREFTNDNKYYDRAVKLVKLKYVC